MSKLSLSGELLRGSLLERTVRHTKDCPKCARGFVEVRRWLSNYQDLKEAIEAICELNHDLLRPERTARKTRSKRHD